MPPFIGFVTVHPPLCSPLGCLSGESQASPTRSNHRVTDRINRHLQATESSPSILFKPQNEPLRSRHVAEIPVTGHRSCAITPLLHNPLFIRCSRLFLNIPSYIFIWAHSGKIWITSKEQGSRAGSVSESLSLTSPPSERRDVPKFILWVFNSLERPRTWNIVTI